MESDAHEATVESVRDAAARRCANVWQIDRGAVDELTAAGAGITDETLDERARVARRPTTPPRSSTPRAPPAAPRAACSPTAASSRSAATSSSACKPAVPYRRRARSCSSCPPRTSSAGSSRSAAVMAPIKLGYVPDIKNLTDELASFRPTLILGVPRVFEKVYNSAPSQGARGRQGQDLRQGRARRRSPTAARWTRRQGPSLGLKFRHKVFDKLVYSKLRAVLGGRGHVRHLRRRPARRAARPLLPRHRLHGPGGLRPDRVLRGHRLQPVGPAEDRHGRPAAAGLRRPDRRRRRGAAARRAPVHRLLEQRGGHRGGAGRRLVPHRRHRHARRGRLPRDHRPQEGDHRHRGRQERRPGGDRGPHPGARR